MREWRSLLPIIVFTALYAVVSLSVTNSYYQLVMTLVPVWAIFGLSWNLLSGYTGLISFGHAAFFGVGAYAVVLGGMGSIMGAFWGGMTIGLVQQMSTLILPTQLQNAAIFVVFLLIIFFRPQGFFGRMVERT